MSLNVGDFLPYTFVIDGSIDYTVPIQAAIDQAVASKRRLIFPAGIFAVSGTGLAVTLTGAQQLAMEGQGFQNTIIRNANGSVLRVSGQFLAAYDMQFLSEGGGHTVLQTGLLAQTLFQQVGFAQNAAGFSVWDNAGEQFIDNRFVACAFDHTPTSTVHGFNLTAAGGLINDNSWLNCRVNNSGTKHFFNLETTTANAQYANKWDGITWEVCLGGGIRLRGVNGFVIENCQNWDAAGIVNDFYDLDTALGISCIGQFLDCGRWASSMASGKYDVSLPGGGGGAGIEFHNCRTAGGGDPFKVNAKNNPVVFSGLSTVFSITNNAGQCGVDPTQGVIMGGKRVVFTRGAAIPAVPSIGTSPTQSDFNGLVTSYNTLLSRLRATGGHGLIED